MESLKKACGPRLICHVTVIASTPVVFFISIYLAKLHPIFLALAPTLLVYPLYLKYVKMGRLMEASIIVFEWALVLTLSAVYATTVMGQSMGSLVIKGEEYRTEMFSWIRTGLGAEGDPSLFVIPKLKEIAVFSIASLASLGFLGLLMGAMLLNYMNYYVGNLLLHAKPGYILQVALLSWPIYAILRVPGYVFLGTALTRIAYLFLKERRLIVERKTRKMLILAAVLIALDFILKSTVANAVYQPLLKKMTDI